VPEEKDTSDKRTWRDRLSRLPGVRRMTPGRRRVVLGVVLALLLVVVFAIVPGYLATQPRFLQRYSHFNKPYKTWSTSVHAKVPCQKCHIAPTIPAQAAYSVRMLGEFYISAVAPSRQPKLLDAPTNAACQSCHLDLRTVSPTGDLNIPHRAHVTVLKMQCVTCHKYLVHDKNPAGTHRPTMATCLTCHDGTKAKNACSTCHTNKGEPISHRQPDWLIIHPEMQAKVDCKSCHQWKATWCSDCHKKRPKSHTADWRTTHGKAVAVRRNCEACHEPEFCIRCHGVVPPQNLNPALKPVQ
jgi:hypothetical protein